MENSFGTSFSDVNVHKDSPEATNMGAKAFAQGNDVHFAPGQYNPESKSGQELIGHELTHVVQQKQGRVKATTQAKGAAVNDDSALEKEADVMGRKAAKGEPAKVSGLGSGVQKKNDDEKVIEELNNRAQGNEEYDYQYNYKEAKNKAKERADGYFENAYGEENMGSFLFTNIIRDTKTIYDRIKSGQNSAITAIESSIEDEKQKMLIYKTALIGLASIVAAWAPLASAGIASVQSRLFSKISSQLGKGVTLKSLKIPTYAKMIQAFGENKMVGPWMSTISTINVFANTFKSKYESPKDAIDKSLNLMSDRTGYAVAALILEMSQVAKSTPKSQLSPDEIGDLRTELEIAILRTIFPEYSNIISDTGRFDQIHELAKTQFLKNIIINSGEISKSQFRDSWDEIEGNKNKEGSSIVKHALNALGGEKALADELKNPYEFAYGSLNSSLAHLGLEINTTSENKIKSRNQDFLATKRGFHVFIKNQDLFKKLLNSTHLYRSFTYEANSGPIKSMEDNYPVEESGLIVTNSITKYGFDFEDVNFDNMEVWIKPSQQTSMLEGKIIDFNSFDLKFDSSGMADVYKCKITSHSGYGGSLPPFTHHGKHPVNGRNKIRVIF
ncbi:hypothetical protein DCC35_16675 [Mangrovivirga cuniculi]|uniref:eCIS core domain-containing protein n=2 Tax=Mangrovivirga cuniculi TaxID=2715131 RepID=A0A4D7K8R8_9BACT|nr:hypothetical protein DCC35_16675 [Mangrovivirga cuniculi]